jgi:hypothetical protein
MSTVASFNRTPPGTHITTRGGPETFTRTVTNQNGARMSYVRMTLAACALALGAAHGAPAATLDSSNADAFSARFVMHGYSASLGPVASVSGAAPPAYYKGASLPSFGAVLHLPAAAVPVFGPAFYVDLGPLNDHVSGSTIGIDNYGSTANSKITSANLALNLDPLPPGQPVPVPPLQIAATGVQASASFNVVVPQLPSTSGAASFTSLSVSGSLVGDKTLTYAGTPPSNFVLYRSPQVTIVLNEQIVDASVVTCIVNHGCIVIPGGISVAAIHVSLTDAPVFGKLITGGFSLGEAAAQ